MTISKRGLAVFAAAAVLLGLAVACLALQKPDRLTGAQLAALRAEYPVYRASNGMAPSVRKMSLAECVALAETFVYGEIAGPRSTYAVSGAFPDAEFYQYPITVLEDTMGLYQKGDSITIAANRLTEDADAPLKEGVRLVVPVIRDKNDQSRCHYTVNGMFYVTAEGYGISAFEEAENPVSGLRVRALMEHVKKK